MSNAGANKTFSTIHNTERLFPVMPLLKNDKSFHPLYGFALESKNDQGATIKNNDK